MLTASLMTVKWASGWPLSADDAKGSETIEIILILCLQIEIRYVNLQSLSGKCINTVIVVQLVRTPDCGSGGRGFESHLPPKV